MLSFYLYKMKAFKRPKISDIVFVILIALLVIPQTRKPIQVGLNKIFALFSPSVVDEGDREQLTNYNWPLVTETGEVFNLNETKGKVVLINFWATWCPPCIAEMESLETLYKQFSSNEDVVFLFATTDPFEKTKAFKEKNNYSFPVYKYTTQEPEQLHSASIPHTVILDKKGNIVVEKSGASNWSSNKVVGLLETLLSK